MTVCRGYGKIQMMRCAVSHCASPRGQGSTDAPPSVDRRSVNCGYLINYMRFIDNVELFCYNNVQRYGAAIARGDEAAVRAVTAGVR